MGCDATFCHTSGFTSRTHPYLSAPIPAIMTPEINPRISKAFEHVLTEDILIITGGFDSQHRVNPKGLNHMEVCPVNNQLNSVAFFSSSLQFKLE